MGFEIKFTAEENAIRVQPVGPTPHLMPLIKNCLLESRWLGHKALIIFFDPKAFGALQSCTKATFGEGSGSHEFKLAQSQRQL
jgi:hypothetical protein